MSHIKSCFLILMMGVLTTVSFANTKPLQNSPLGYWKTLDDVTGKPKSIVQISKAENGTLVGKVIKLFPSKTPNPYKDICTACDGDKRNMPILGMVILSGITANSPKLNRGQIFDPENGKTYKCSLRVADNGKKLNILGYIGIPLLGRSQIWERVDLMSE